MNLGSLPGTQDYAPRQGHAFLDERLARHYGISGVDGSGVRRAGLGQEFDMRRGLLGEGDGFIFAPEWTTIGNLWIDVASRYGIELASTR